METNSENTGAGEYGQDFKPGAKFWLALTPLLVVACMASLDSTSVSVALPVSTFLGSYKKQFSIKYR